jgi:serine/threonine-protein kinase
VAGIEDDVTFDPLAGREPATGPSPADAATIAAVNTAGVTNLAHAATRVDTMAATIATPAPPATPSSRTSRATRFEPGVIVAGRYRLVALLGKGGMGEVYRAEDLTLDQPVALKFLPRDVAVGDARLSRFHNELRVARQVSHKNVCRLYDLGDADGQRFLTMEYVDGEDLASLLRRIGRIPQDKAIQVARQLCAGVAAAHDRGVLHRDLKPANVMIDGEGDVRVTDFGIATAAASDAAGEFIGTPQYMAPELFAGQPASVASDIYALGLTLYEVFTGKRAYESDTLQGLKELHRTGTMPTPSSIVRDLDPAVERVIVRCLEKDPAQRPASALAVAALLPGADALADALAAGETPSPQLIAAAAETDAIPVWRAAAAVAGIAAGLLAIAAVSGATAFARRAPLEKPPEVLVDRAETIVRAVGYKQPIIERASGFFLGEDYTDWIRAHDDSASRWNRLATDLPTPVRFWYRASPAEMRALDTDGVISMTDPPLTRPNMRLVILDSGGRLIRFRSVPPEREPESAGPLEWRGLFAAAGLDQEQFVPVPSSVAPPDFADSRFAWDGPVPGRTDLTLHVEAAARGGMPVSFWVRGPWTTVAAGTARPVAFGEKVFVAIALLFVAIMTVAAIVLSRRHIATGRADLQGAKRLAVWLSVPLLVVWTMRSHHSWQADAEINAFFNGLAGALLSGLAISALYLALEPYVRRFWPHSLLGWSRLAAGHLRDARVGYEVFAGMLGGLALTTNDLVRVNLIPRFGWPAPYVIYGRELAMLAASSEVTFRWMDWVRVSVQSGLVLVLLIVLLRLTLRRIWLAAPVAVVLLSLVGRNYLQGSGPWMQLFPIVSALIVVLVALRFGLLALVIAYFVWEVTYGTPLTLDVAQWSAGGSNWTLAMLFALAAFAYYASRSGAPLFGGEIRVSR